jgi:NAD(P)-dependent dehydrogenase (short-subunit alcohol dehydrogenase family)
MVHERPVGQGGVGDLGQAGHRPCETAGLIEALGRRALVVAVEAGLGPMDVLVNNAGVARPLPLMTQTVLRGCGPGQHCPSAATPMMAGTPPI